MSNVRVVFFKGRGGWADTSVRWWTWSPYSHCELVFGDGTWFGSGTTGEMRTRFRAPSDTPDLVGQGLPGYGPGWADFVKNWDVIQVPMSEEDEAAMRAFCMLEVSCRYDWAGLIFSQLLNLCYHSETKWFCSEVVAAALQKANVHLTLEPQRYAPGDLFKALRDLFPPATQPIGPDPLFSLKASLG
jgi:hypothetical protein